MLELTTGSGFVKSSIIMVHQSRAQSCEALTCHLERNEFDQSRTASWLQIAPWVNDKLFNKEVLAHCAPQFETCLKELRELFAPLMTDAGQGAAAEREAVNAVYGVLQRLATRKAG